jgi:hypothetical protein
VAPNVVLLVDEVRRLIDEAEPLLGIFVSH